MGSNIPTIRVKELQGKVAFVTSGASGVGGASTRSPSACRVRRHRGVLQSGSFRDGVRHPLRQGAVRRRCGKQLPDLVERKAESLVSPDTPQGSYLIAAVEAIAGVGARGRLQQVDASQWCRARTVSPDNAAASLTLYMFPPVSIRFRRQVNRL